ncbi:hypothetical protein IFM89_038187 [Coptis chinensis]|uniref:Uncharacterized protein n=1 Tax=Coptis chinensis TaxID=261450 RepID=A0A835I7Q1_9MAGN|nr:hypothetical protein IFM89_038187 [Coptis chinensis]
MQQVVDDYGLEVSVGLSQAASHAIAAESKSNEKCVLFVDPISLITKNVVTGTELFDLRKELGITEEWLYILTKVEEDKLLWHTFDPLSKSGNGCHPSAPQQLRERSLGSY